MEKEKEKPKRWTKKEYDAQLNNLQRTCAELDRQNQVLRTRNLVLVEMLNEAISSLSQVMTRLTSKVNV